MTIKEYLQMSKEELAVELAVRDRLELHKENKELKAKLAQIEDELHSTSLMMQLTKELPFPYPI